MTGEARIRLVELLGLDRLPSLAIIGTGKNAGKTTVLNHILEACGQPDFKRTLAITSIGLDGEGRDQLTGAAKPGIFLGEGQLIATARASVSKSDSVLEVLALTGIQTASGEIVIARTRSKGYLELAGPSVAADIRRCEGYFRKEAPDCLLIVDGALSRRSSAGGGLTKAAVLVAGLANAVSPDELAEKTARLVDLLTLKAFNEDLRRECLEALRARPRARALILNGSGGLRRTLEFPSLAGHGSEIAKALLPGDRLLLLRGAVTARLVGELMKSQSFSEMTLAGEDGTRFFLDDRSLSQLKGRALSLTVLHELSLPCVFVNPARGDGSLADSRLLVETLRARIDKPVADLGPALAWSEKGGTGLC